VTVSGNSRLDRCPDCGATTRGAHSMASAVSRARSGGVMTSDSPRRTSVGISISESRGGIGPAHDRPLLPDESFRSGLAHHLASDMLQVAVYPPVRRHEARPEIQVNLLVATRLRHVDQVLAIPAHFIHVRPSSRAEQGQPRHPPGRLSHDLERHIATQDMPARAKRAGAWSRSCRAIAAMDSSLAWSATMIGRDPETAAICDL
jgi:hypothetical protein